MKGNNIIKKLLIFFFCQAIIIFVCAASYEETGIASWYGPDFHGKTTANGEIFNTNNFTAAHRTLPFGTIVKITSLTNNKSTIVRINDRGPFVGNRIIDLSRAAADELEMTKNGTMNVKLEVIEQGDNKYHRFTKNKYLIQLASFDSEKNAENYINSHNGEILNFKISSIKLDKYYYRVIIDNLNYYELQEMRIVLLNNDITGYLVKRKKSRE